MHLLPRVEERSNHNVFRVGLYGVITANGVTNNINLIFRHSLDKLKGFRYNDVEYIYKRNIQGDITQIINGSGVVVAKYIYDAWGNHKVLNPDETENTDLLFIGNLNPFRYRGYQFDQETKLYYLNSRYYDSEVGRFISPDSIEYLDPESINGLNLYCYCGNNPVMNVDPSGHKWYHWVLAIVAAVAIIALAIFTAGAIIAAAPAIASYASMTAVAYTGSLAIGSAVATAVSVGAGVLAIGTIVIGVNEGVTALTGYNIGREILGDKIYNGISTTIAIGGTAYIYLGMTLPYPSTCNSPDYTSPKNLKD